MGSDLTTFSFDLLLKLASFAMSVGAVIYAFFANRRKDVEVQFKAGSKRMDALEKRIAASEHRIDTLPNKDELHQLTLGISELGGDVKAMAMAQNSTNELLRRLENIVDRHEGHLLESKR